MTRRIDVINAGAGSGKTFRVVQELLRRLLPEDGSEPVAPGAILVTTFTRLAAAEVSDRVREALIGKGREDLARRLGEGLLGTVDSVANELVRRFAFDAGLSPQPLVVDEEEGYRAFSEALALALDPETLAQMQRSEELLGLGGDDPGGRVGFNPFQARGWRKTAMEIAQMARSNDITGQPLLDCAESSIAAFEALLPAAESDGPALDLALRSAVDEAIEALPGPGDTTDTTAKYKRFLQDMRIKLSSRRVPWSDWVKLSKEKPGTKSAVAAEPVRSAASRHLVHPGMRQDVALYVRTIFKLAARSIDIYQQWKEERGLLDFVDLETRAHWLMKRDDVARRLAERVKLVLVDEFQDTNPLQLALFLKLAGVASRSIWVGDPKQTIYEFRGADPKLMKSVLKQLGNPRPEDILRHSHRSRPELVDLVSELFVPAFEGLLPPDQVRLEAVREPVEGLLPPVHYWKIEESKNLAEVSASIARGIAGLIGTAGVYDKQTQQVRPARPSDVAVLCFTGNRCQRISNALEAIGIRTALERKGLMGTPEAVLVIACLRRLVDPGDSLATAEIVSLVSGDAEPEQWLSERIAYLSTGQPKSEWRKLDPAVQPLEAIRDRLDYLSPTEVLDRVLSVMDVHRRVLAWGREEVRLGNLEALRRLAGRYEDGCGRVHSGASVAGFVHWLQELAEVERDQQAKGIGPQAVQVLTVHGSKGLEWPIVVLAQLDREFEPNVWTLRPMEAPEEMSLENPLSGRCLRYWPWPYGLTRQVPGLDEALDRSEEQAKSASEQQEEAVRLLYVAMTRARDALVIPEWKKVRGTKDSPRPWLGLVFGENLKFLEGPGVAVARLTPSEPVHPVTPEAAWFPAPYLGAEHPPACISPSSLRMPPGERIATGEAIRTGEPLSPMLEMATDLLGTAVHGFLGADADGLTEEDRLSIAAGLLQRYGVTELTPRFLVTRGDELRAAIGDRHGDGTWLREWPARLMHDEVLIPGTIDLAVETAEGWVLVDHKCFAAGPEQWSELAAGCAPQLGAYALALTAATGKPLLAAYVHLPLWGALVPVELPPLEEFLSRVVAVYS